MNIAGLSGIGTEGVLLLILYLIVKDVLSPIVKKSTAWQNYRGRKGNNGTVTQRIKLTNPYPPPGQGSECIEHGKQLTELDTKLDMFMGTCEKEFKRLSGNIKDLFDKYDSVKKR